MRTAALGLIAALVSVGCRESSPPAVAASPPQAGASAQPAASDSPPPGPLAVPGPAASPCTSDAMCLRHRCNLAYGKCAFPCESDADCVAGTTCFKSAISTCQSAPPGAVSAEKR